MNSKQLKNKSIITDIVSSKTTWKSSNQHRKNNSSIHKKNHLDSYHNVSTGCDSRTFIEPSNILSSSWIKTPWLGQ